MPRHTMYFIADCTAIYVAIHQLTSAPGGEAPNAWGTRLHHPRIGNIISNKDMKLIFKIPPKWDIYPILPSLAGFFLLRPESWLLVFGLQLLRFRGARGRCSLALLVAFNDRFFKGRAIPSHHSSWLISFLTYYGLL